MTGSRSGPGPDLSAVGLEARNAQALPGGDINRAWRVELSDRLTVFVKESPRPEPGLFTLEAAGLDWLRACGARVPQIRAVGDHVLVLSWVDVERPDREAAFEFGRMLARVHSRPADAFGAPPPGVERRTKGWVGTVPVPFGAFDSWAQFWVEARLRPAADAAQHLGGLTTTMRVAIDDLCDALSARPHEVGGPPVDPAVTHGDLWSGNVLWQRDGVTLVDPAAVGGHPETDLAMLQLFGVPQWPRVRAGYESVRAMPSGWEQRVPLHQVFPLLVHAAMFGAGYGAQAARAARTALSG